MDKIIIKKEKKITGKYLEEIIFYVDQRTDLNLYGPF